MDELQMAEYIDRKEAVSAACAGADAWDGGCNASRDKYLAEYIGRVSAADVAPVRHSVIVDRRKVEVDGEWECARCGWQYMVCVCGKDVTQKIHYCPYCGANIDGEKAELWREYTPRVW